MMMNEELQQALAELITKSTAVAGDALAFTQDQLPDVVQQLLVWRGVYSLVMFVAGALLLVAASLCAKAAMRKRAEAIAQAEEAYRNGEAWTRMFNGLSTTSTRYDSIMVFGGAPTMVMASVSAAMAIAGMTMVNLEWLQIWLAPKVYLIEYAANLVK